MKTKIYEAPYFALFSTLTLFVSFKSKQSPQHSVLKRLQSSLRKGDQVSHPYKTAGKIHEYLQILHETYFIC